jgi:hypothetical protein
MKKRTNTNFITASNLIFISALLGLINFLFFSLAKSSYEVIVGIIVISFITGIGFLVRKAYQWIKWVLLILIVLGILATIMALPAILGQSSIVILISLSQTLLQAISVVLMFLPNKSQVDNVVELPEDN